MKNKNVEIRIYKHHDLDLMALHDAGYPIMDLMRTAVSAYANGKPVYFLLREPVEFDLNNKQSFRMRFSVPSSDEKTIKLLEGIKHRRVCSFCKMVFRNALVFQNLTPYFANKDLFGTHQSFIDSLDPASIPNLIVCDKKKANKCKEKRDKKTLEWANKELASTNSYSYANKQALNEEIKDIHKETFESIQSEQSNSNVATQNPMQTMNFTPEMMQTMMQMFNAQLMAQGMAPTAHTSMENTIPVINPSIVSQPSSTMNVETNNTADEGMNVAENDDIMAAFEGLMN